MARRGCRGLFPSIRVYRLIMPVVRVGEYVGPVSSPYLILATLADIGAEYASSVYKLIRLQPGAAVTWSHGLPPFIRQ